MAERGRLVGRHVVSVKGAGGDRNAMRLTLGRGGDLLSGYLSAKRYWRGPKSQEVGERGRRVERQVSQPSRLTGRQKPSIYQSIRRGTDWDRNPVRLGRDGVLLTGVRRGATVDILVDIFRVCHLRLSSVARTRSGKMLNLAQLPWTAGEHGQTVWDSRGTL